MSCDVIHYAMHSSNRKTRKLTFFPQTSPRKPLRRRCIYKQTAFGTATGHQPVLG